MKTNYLAVALLALAALGCTTTPETWGPCRTPDGRFVSCRERGEPVGATYNPDRGWLCRDAKGITWPSWGECD